MLNSSGEQLAFFVAKFAIPARQVDDKKPCYLVVYLAICALRSSSALLHLASYDDIMIKWKLQVATHGQLLREQSLRKPNPTFAPAPSFVKR